MDLSAFTEELNKAGLQASEEKQDRFIRPKDLIYPFSTMTDGVVYSVEMREVKDANFIDKTKQPISKEELELRCKIANGPYSYDHEEIKIKEFLLDHIDKARVITKGECKIKDSYKRFGVSTGDFYSETHEPDTEYGFCCLAWYIYYSKAEMRFKLIMNGSYSKTEKLIYQKLHKHVNLFSSINNQMELIGYLTEISEFIPLYIPDEKIYMGFMLNQVSEKKKGGELHPSYGENILACEELMNKLMENPMYDGKVIIKPDRLYYVMYNKNAQYVWVEKVEVKKNENK